MLMRCIQSNNKCTLHLYKLFLYTFLHCFVKFFMSIPILSQINSMIFRYPIKTWTIVWCLLIVDSSQMSESIFIMTNSIYNIVTLPVVYVRAHMQRTRWLYIKVALFSKILFKIVIRHNILRLFPKNPKNYKFSKNYPFEACQFWNFSGFAQFSVLTYFHYFGFFGIILSRSMEENSAILKISPFGYNFLSWLILKIQLFLAILKESLPENNASILLSFGNPL